MVTFKKTKASRLNIKMNLQRRSLKAILLLFIEPCTAGPRGAKKYVNPDITKVSVTVNRSPNRIYNNSNEAQDMWREISQLFQSILPSKQNGPHKVLHGSQVWVDH